MVLVWNPIPPYQGLSLSRADALRAQPSVSLLSWTAVIADNLFSDYKIDQEQLRAIGRLGGPSYVRTTDRFDMPRTK